MNNPAALQKLLKECRDRYPLSFKLPEIARASKGKDVPDWPNWCYFPMAGVAASVIGEIGKQMEDDDYELEASKKGNDIANVASMCAWRFTQGVYRFDSDLYDAITATEITSSLPTTVFTRLPEWCVYIELKQRHEHDPLGVFAHVECNAVTGTTKFDEVNPELRLLFNYGNDWDQLAPVPLTTGLSIKDSIEKLLSRCIAKAKKYNLEVDDSVIHRKQFYSEISKTVSLVMYLCSVNADLPSPGPALPAAKKTRQGIKMFAPDAPKVWEVGVRIGSTLRAAKVVQRSESSGTGKNVRTHIRRAHWHHYWTGPKTGEQELILKWLHPTIVAAEQETELPVVVHPVKK